MSRKRGPVIADWRSARLSGWRRTLWCSTVVTNGCFDLLGPHHVQLLEYMRHVQAWPNNAMIVVCLNSDDSVRRLKGDDRPIIPFADRAYMLISLSAVDQVIGFDEDTPEELYRVLRPDVLCKGADAQRPYPGEQYATRICTAPAFAGSTTDTIRRIRGK